MSDGGDRRARKKAATRALVLETAQRLFAERGYEAVTVADIAATADVAVQTVFNHFPTKEGLFFTGRASWVDAPAAAVRARPAGVSPLAALRPALVAEVEAHIAGLADPAHRGMVTTMTASPALQAHERELNDQARARLHAALLEAWSAADSGRRPPDVHLTAALVAATWTAAARTVAAETRQPLPEPPEVPDRARAAAALAEQVLSALETALRASAAVDPRDTA
ncbi:TetR/AcrR family transcriptional regulator [Trujillonella humicola]|uniref:TetR/AcrR family transcriptional regulator n=1 Tax=Trujillonella humicola TaxID=3383699 RepID=UPI003905CF74